MPKAYYRTVACAFALLLVRLIIKMDLYDAVLEEDFDEVKRLLQECSTKAEVDCPDNNARTAFMAAARGNGKGGVKFYRMLKCFWQRYTQLGCDLVAILQETDDKRGFNWNLFMYSAKCGDIQNLKLVLSFYRQMGLVEKLKARGIIDWTNVDHREAKDFISESVFNGEVQYVTNFGSPRRSSRSTAKKSNNRKGMEDRAEGRAFGTKRVTEEEMGSETAKKRKAKKKRNDEGAAKKETTVKADTNVKKVNVKEEVHDGQSSDEEDMGENVIEIESDQDDPVAATAHAPVNHPPPPAPPPAAAPPTAAIGNDQLRRERDAALAEVKRLKKVVQAMSKALTDSGEE